MKCSADLTMAKMRLKMESGFNVLDLSFDDNFIEKTKLFCLKYCSL